MIVPQGLVHAINSLQQNMFINAPTISQTAALKCWDQDTRAQLEQHVTKYRTSRGVILEALQGFTELNPKNIAPADGGFYVYIDLGVDNVAPGFGSVNMCKTLLEEEYVAFAPGSFRIVVIECFLLGTERTVSVSNDLPLSLSLSCTFIY
jgi:aspartate/methionine/tyrosine aminotransferase